VFAQSQETLHSGEKDIGQHIQEQIDEE